jgi:soluble lytic murein transglycosylase-like protein
MARLLITILLLFVLASVKADCFDDAGARFKVHPDLLRAMGEQESNLQADALGPVLKGGHRAVGLMQVNTVHLPELAPYGIKRDDLMEKCVSVHVGAWIFARYRVKVGDTWAAVGVYNTGPYSEDTGAQSRYIAAVRRRFERIQSARHRGASALPGAKPSSEQVRASVKTMTVWEAE